MYINCLITNPHGLEWKNQFRILILPVLNPDIFPKVLLPLKEGTKNFSSKISKASELVKELKIKSDDADEKKDLL